MWALHPSPMPREPRDQHIRAWAGPSAGVGAGKGRRKDCAPAGGHHALLWFSVLSRPAAAVTLSVVWKFRRRALEPSILM